MKKNLEDLKRIIPHVERDRCYCPCCGCIFEDTYQRCSGGAITGLYGKWYNSGPCDKCHSKLFPKALLPRAFDA